MVEKNSVTLKIDVRLWTILSVVIVALTHTSTAQSANTKSCTGKPYSVEHLLCSATPIQLSNGPLVRDVLLNVTDVREFYDVQKRQDLLRMLTALRTFIRYARFNRGPYMKGADTKQATAHKRLVDSDQDLALFRQFVSEKIQSGAITGRPIEQLWREKVDLFYNSTLSVVIDRFRDIEHSKKARALLAQIKPVEITQNVSVANSFLEVYARNATTFGNVEEREELHKKLLMMQTVTREKSSALSLMLNRTVDGTSLHRTVAERLANVTNTQAKIEQMLQTVSNPRTQLNETVRADWGSVLTEFKANNWPETTTKRPPVHHQPPEVHSAGSAVAGQMVIILSTVVLWFFLSAVCRVHV